MITATTEAAVDVRGLRVEDRAGRAILRDVSFSISHGDRLAVVGESGAGKTTLALGLLGYFRPGLRHAAGSVSVAGHHVLGSTPSQVRRYRRTVISYLGQDPAAALTPSLRLEHQIGELMRGAHDTEAVRQRMALVGLPSDREFAGRYPHEVSGGQLQRVAIARALASDPAVLVLDEPTAALDIMTRRLITDEIERQADRLGITLILVSHDLKAVARTANRVLVLRDGRIVDQGEVPAVLSDPRHPYTSELVAAHDGRTRREYGQGPQDDGRSRTTPALAVRGLAAGFRNRKVHHRVVDRVDLDIDPGECVALVGMSGAGKTTIARCLLGLHEPESGSIAVNGIDLAPRARDRPVALRRSIQFVPQDPEGSLNPRRRVGDTLGHTLRSARGLDRGRAEDAALDLVHRVRLSPELLPRFPRQLSGGERQRIAIARALATEPSVLVCDEVTSSLDVSVEAAVLDLIDELRRDGDMAVLLITHDLRVVRRVADRVLVLHNGVVHEQGAVARVLQAPERRFTRSMLEADRPVSEILRRRAGRNPGALDPAQAKTRRAAK